MILTTAYRNLDKIKFGWSLISAKTTPPVVEIPLENIVQSGNTVDIAVANEDNAEAGKEIENNKDFLESEATTVEDTDIITSISDIISKAIPLIVDKKTEEKIENDKKDFNTITNRYNAQLKELEKDLEKDLLILIDIAYKDYISGKYTTSNLANKYLDMGVNLEAISDSKFYTLLKDFENELKENSYDTQILKEVEKYYISLKQLKKNEIINMGMELGKK